MNIVLIGRTGSGKTTVAASLTEHLNVPYISSGDIARDMARGDPATDMALRQGAHAPEEAMRSAVRDALEQGDAQHGGWILEGFPRMVAQLVCIMQWTVSLPTFVYLDTPEWVCIERLTARKRPDDNADSIARKLQSFKENTLPVVDVLEEGGVLHHLELSGNTNGEIVQEILGLL